MYIAISKYEKNGDISPYLLETNSDGIALHILNSPTVEVGISLLVEFESSKSTIIPYITSFENFLGMLWVNTENYSYQISKWRDLEDFNSMILTLHSYPDFIEYVNIRTKILDYLKINLLHIGLLQVDEKENITVEVLDMLIKNSEVTPFPNIFPFVNNV